MRVTLFLISLALRYGISPNETKFQRYFDPQAQALARIIAWRNHQREPLFLRLHRPQVPKSPHCESIVGMQFGAQAELGKAAKTFMEEAMAKFKGSSKGYSMGKGKIHWPSPFIYFSSWNPNPIPRFWKLLKPLATAGMSTAINFQRHLKVGGQAALFGHRYTAPGERICFQKRPPKSPPPTGKAKSKSYAALLQFVIPNGPTLISPIWATPPIKSQQIQLFQWQPLPFEIVNRSWAPLLWLSWLASPVQ